jgi:serine/threonine protein kinase
LNRYPPFTGDEPNKTIFERILSERIESPDFFDPNARDLIAGLCMVDASQRLGCKEGGVNDIKNHPWFQDIEWDSLIKKATPGPLNPGITRDGDTHNFYKYSDVNINEEMAANIDYDALFKDF